MRRLNWALNKQMSDLFHVALHAWIARMVKTCSFCLIAILIVLSPMHSLHLIVSVTAHFPREWNTGLSLKRTWSRLQWKCFRKPETLVYAVSRRMCCCSCCSCSCCSCSCLKYDCVCICSLQNACSIFLGNRFKHHNITLESSGKNSRMYEQWGKFKLLKFNTKPRSKTNLFHTASCTSYRQERMQTFT